MATFGTIKTRIVDLYKGSAGASFTDKIGTAINEAIEYYNHKDVWFRETTLSITLTIGQPELTAHASWPANFWFLDNDAPITIFHSNNRYLCTQISPGEFEAMQDTGTGRPQVFRYQSGKVEVFPIPDQAYVTEIKYTKSYSLLVDDTDTNDWLTYAPQLITARALSQLFLGQGHDKDSMHLFWREQEREHLNSLLETNRRRKATGNTVIEW